MAKGSTAGKNPSVEWFWNDWHGGTMTMSRHQKGCYMDLLTAQFNNGHLSIEEIRNVLGNDFAAWQGVLQKKFAQDSDGRFYNVRLDFQIKKKGAYNKSRTDNLNGSNGDSPHMGYGNDSGFASASGFEKGVQGEKHKYQDMIDSGAYLSIQKMKTQLSFLECQKLELEFGDKIVEEVFNSMDNKPDLTKKYTSVYRTALDWCKRRVANPINIIQGGKQQSNTAPGANRNNKDFHSQRNASQLDQIFGPSGQDKAAS